MTDLRSRIISATIAEAHLHGIAHVTRSGIAARAGVPTGSLTHSATEPGERRITLADLKRLAVLADPTLAQQPAGLPGVRDERLLSAAVRVALRDGLPGVTRAAVASEAGVSTGTVSNYGAPVLTERLADPMGQLRDDVMHRAVRDSLTPLVRAGLAAGHAAALEAPADLRARALLDAVI